jgi:hypothetical protein
MPSKPNPTTAKPITAPPRKPIGKALFNPFLAALAAFAFAFVATDKPKYPARAEQKEPKRYANAIDKCFTRSAPGLHTGGNGKKMKIKTETTPTNNANVLYSRLRNAKAPSVIAEEISFILSVPLSCLFT